MKLLLAAMLVAVFPLFAAATTVVDQENTIDYGAADVLNYPGDYFAQTFTVRNSGQITSVALQLLFSVNLFDKANALPGATLDNLHFSLTRTNSAGEPLLNDVLATAEILPQTLPTAAGLWPDVSPKTEIDLHDQHVNVTAGDLLALVVTSSYAYYNHLGEPDYAWRMDISRDDIAGGKFFAYSPQSFGPGWFSNWTLGDPPGTTDAGYRITIATVPEPSGILLGTLAIAALIAHPRRTRKV